MACASGTPALFISAALDDIEDKRDIEHLSKPFGPVIHPDLHCVLLNWVDRNDALADRGFGQALALGLRDVLSYGNSHLCQLASNALAQLGGLDRFHVGGAGVCRIVWGPFMRLDDCTCQGVAIGTLAFHAMDYGDDLRLNDSAQRQLCSSGREERNRCALIASAAGIAAPSHRPPKIPANSPLIQLALELRLAEWRAANPFPTSSGVSKSYNEKAIVSLRRDIVRAGHDRDYRSLSLFLGQFFGQNRLALRVFGVSHSGSGDAALHINVIGDLDKGRENGLIDVQATNGHTCWLQSSNETSPPPLGPIGFPT